MSQLTKREQLIHEYIKAMLYRNGAFHVGKKGIFADAVYYADALLRELERTSLAELESDKQKNHETE